MSVAPATPVGSSDPQPAPAQSATVQPEEDRLEATRPATASQPRAIVVMGVSGCGKTTVGRALADALGWRFVDADDFHPSANVDKMRAGVALDDADRAPWLARLNAVLRHAVARDAPLVLACSALKARYRERLRERAPRLAFVHLAGDFDTIAARIAARSGHYMPPALLRSQFEALEPPEDALAIDVREDVASIVARVREALAV